MLRYEINEARSLVAVRAKLLVWKACESPNKSSLPFSACNRPFAHVLQKLIVSLKLLWTTFLVLVLLKGCAAAAHRCRRPPPLPAFAGTSVRDRPASQTLANQLVSQLID